MRGVSVRPRVFEFEPGTDANHIIDIPNLTRPATRRILPKGVLAETSSRFEWKEEMRFVFSATDFRKSHGGSFELSVGAEVASFSASASFKKINKSTSEDKTSFAYKDGTFRGHTMELDSDYTHKLTPKFRKAIDSITSDTATTNKFILNWGTHYTDRVTIGASCAYRFEHTYKERSSTAGDSASFKLKVSGGVKALEVGVGGSYEQSTMNTVKSATGTENVDFVSYGGSGAAMDSFADWTEHALNNPTVVDLHAALYTTLLNRRYFPKDLLIDEKKRWLDSALVRHFKKGKVEIPVSEPSFDYRNDLVFEVTLSNLRNAEMNVDYHPEYHGLLFIQPYDLNYKAFAPLVMDGSAQNMLEITEFGFPVWMAREDAKWIPAANGDVLSLDKKIRFRVKWDQAITGYVSLTGLINDFWAGTSPIKTPVDKDNRIMFADVDVGKEVTKTVDFVMDKEQTKILTVTAEMRLKQLRPDNYGWTCEELLKTWTEMDCVERSHIWSVEWADFMGGKHSGYGCPQAPFRDLAIECEL